MMLGHIVTAITYDNTHFSYQKIGDLQSCTGLDRKATSTALPDSIRQYLSASITSSTRKTYQTDLADFIMWGGCVPSSPDMIAAYLADRANSLSPVTLARRLVAIGRAHASQHLVDPTKADLVRTVLRGIKRTNGVAQRQVSPVFREDLLAMLPTMSGIKGLRDRALMLLGLAAALR